MPMVIIMYANTRIPTDPALLGLVGRSSEGAMVGIAVGAAVGEIMSQGVVGTVSLYPRPLSFNVATSHVHSGLQDTTQSSPFWSQFDHP